MPYHVTRLGWDYPSIEHCSRGNHDLHLSNLAFGSYRSPLATLDWPSKISGNARHHFSESSPWGNHLPTSATVARRPLAGQASSNSSDVAGYLADLFSAYWPRRSNRTASTPLLKATAHVFAYYRTYIFMVIAFLCARSRSIPKSVNNSIRGAGYHTHTHTLPCCDHDSATREFQTDQPNERGRVDLSYHDEW